MLDFSCTYTSKDNTIEITKKLVIKINGKKIALEDVTRKWLKDKCLTAKEAKGITEALQFAILKNKVKIHKIKFEDAIKCVKQIEIVREMIKELRTTHITNNKSATNIRDDYNRMISNHFYDGTYSYNQGKNNFSVPQQLVLYTLSDEQLYWFMSTDDLTDLYNPITDNKNKLEKYYQNLIAFPYHNYGVSKKDIVARITKKRDKAVKSIEAYSFIKAEAGKDIVNWSQQKISRRLTDNNYSVGQWAISHWVDKLKKNYTKKGIKAIPVEKKFSNLQKIQAKIKTGYKGVEETEKLTQDEYLTLFKSGSKDSYRWALGHLNYDNLMLLMDSELKAVNNKLQLKDLDYNEKRKADNCMDMFTNRLCQRFKGKIEDFNKFLKYIKERDSGFINLTWDFLRRHKDWVSVSDLVDFATINSKLPEDWNNEIPEDLWESHFKPLEETTIVNMSDLITKEFVRRLPEAQKISILPILVKEKVYGENSYRFIMESFDPDWVFEEKKFDTTDLEKLYTNVKWEAIRETILESDSLLKDAHNLIVKNKDKECAEKLLLKEAAHFGWGSNCPVNLFDLFDIKDKVKIILEVDEDRRNSNDHYGNYVSEIFPTEDGLEHLYRECLIAESHSYVTKACGIYSTRKYNLDTLNKAILKTGEFSSFPIDAITLKILSKEVRLFLAKRYNGIVAERRADVDSVTALFYKGFTKEDVLNTVGENFTIKPDNIYFCHLMTKEEKIQACEKDSNFLRVHFEKMPYGYLSKYKDKALLKDLVGDCRDTNNKYFRQLAERVLSKITNKNSLDFICN